MDNRPNSIQLPSQLQNQLPDLLPVGVLIGQAGQNDSRILYVNRAYSRITGYAIEELIGQNPDMLQGPETDAETVIAMQTCIREQQQGTFEILNYRKDGSTFRNRLHVTPLPDTLENKTYFLAVAEDCGATATSVCEHSDDIAERKRIEEDLRLSKELLEGVFQGSPVGIQIFDATGTALRVNRSFVEMLGLPSEDEVMGKYVIYEDPFSVQNGGVTAFKRALRGTVATLNNIHVDFSDLDPQWAIQNKSWWADCIFFPVFDQVGTVEFVVLFVIDVTQRKQTEEEQLRLEDRMRETQKLESLGVLAGGIAHDFNNLLTVIMGNANLAKTNVPSESPSVEFLNQVDSACQSAADLCQQMLAYAGKARVMIHPVTLNDLILNISNLLTHAISKKATVSFDLAPDLPNIEADAVQMRQILLNLVINASEAIPNTGGFIVVSTSVATVDRNDLDTMILGDLRTPGDYVRLQVSDSGNGMDEEIQRRIFEPFFTTKFTGRGLGLAAVLGIMRKHNGALHLQSSPDGTVFQLFFPTFNGNVSVPIATAMESDTLTDAEGTILIADDEKGVRDVAANFLRSFGFQILEATNGREAVERIRDHGSTIRAVLLDLMMPEMDGREALPEIRKLHPKMPILILSGFTEAEIASGYEGPMPDGFLHKPFTRDQLLAHLKGILQARK